MAKSCWPSESVAQCCALRMFTYVAQPILVIEVHSANFGHHICVRDLLVAPRRTSSQGAALREQRARAFWALWGAMRHGHRGRVYHHRCSSGHLARRPAYLLNSHTLKAPCKAPPEKTRQSSVSRGAPRSLVTSGSCDPCFIVLIAPRVCNICLFC